MQTFKTILRVLSNKFVIASIVFAVLMLFVDKNDVFVQMQRKKQLSDLLASKKFYEAEIAKTQKNLSDLGGNSSLEKYARETYLMKKDNEDIFVVDSTAAGSEKK